MSEYRFEIGDRVITTPTFRSLAATVVAHAPMDSFDGSRVYYVRFDGYLGVNPDGSAKLSKLLEWVARPLPMKRAFTLDSILDGSV